MFFHLFKCIRELFALLVLLVLGFIFTTSYFFITKWKNEVKVNILRPKFTRNYDTGHLVKVNKHVSLLIEDFRKSLDLYKAERISFHKRASVVQNTSLLDLVLHRNGKKQNIVCSKDLFLLIQVHSSPTNFMSRQAIRLSWGSVKHFIGDQQESIGQRSWKTVFLIGKSSNPKLNHLVTQEAAIYKDIVLGAFEDTFRNLYMKMILSLTWPLEQNCNASYILKTDEDCFVKIRNLLYWLNKHHIANGTQPIYAGRVQVKMPVIRRNASRYYLSEKEFPGKYFSPYVSGGGYVFSRNLLPLLSLVSKTSPLFPNEDALLGSLMHKIGVKPTDNVKFLPFVFCFPKSTDELKEAYMCGLSRQIIVHGVKEQEQLKMHFNSALLNFLPSFCSLPDSYENIRDQCKRYDMERNITVTVNNTVTVRP